MINATNIKPFVDQLPDTKNKTVLYLKGNVLDVKFLSQTTLYERVLEWFGLGPLSLKNIVKVIHDDVLKTIPGLSTKLLTSCENYNRSHSVQKISRVFIDQLSEKCRLQFAEIGNTAISPNLIIDFAYSDALLGTAYVIDGAGENTIDNRKALESKISNFRSNYTRLFKQQQFDFIEEASDWFKAQMGLLLNSRTDSCDFDLCWIQKVKIGNQLFLLTCQQGSVAAFIKHSDGTIDGIPMKTAARIFSEKPISHADIIVGITDGLGDFITHSEMISALKTVDISSAQLHTTLYSRDNPEDLPSEKSASGKPSTKKLEKSKGGNTALFVLR